MADDETLHLNAWTTGLPDKLQRWLGQLLDNMKEIVAHLPEAESYAVSAGRPTGVSVTVTFTARTGKGPGS